MAITFAVGDYYSRSHSQKADHAMAMWLYVPSGGFSNTAFLFSWYLNSTTYRRVYVATTGTASIQLRDGGTNVTATTANAVNEGAWNHIYAADVGLSGSEFTVDRREIRLNGGTLAMEDTNNSAGVSDMYVGNYVGSGDDYQIAHFAYWSAPVSTARQIALANGAIPLAVPDVEGNLPAYAPLLETPMSYVNNTGTWTTNGTPDDAPVDAPLSWPTRSIFFPHAGGASVVSPIPLLSRSAA